MHRSLLSLAGVLPLSLVACSSTSHAPDNNRNDWAGNTTFTDPVDLATFAPQRPAFLPASYHLVWHDEFDGPAGAPADPARWADWETGTRRGAINTHDSAALDGQGHLRLTTSKVSRLYPGEQMRPEYHTAMLATEHLFEPTFGYIECRYQAQTQPGHWSAFWLHTRSMGQFRGDPARSGAEIDVQEYLATAEFKDRALSTIHWDGYGAEHQSDSHPTVIPGLGQGFHTFGVLWTPDSYTFYVDGHETHRTAKGVSHHPEFIILSLEVGPWAKNIDEAVLPDSMVVDYVRVWQSQAQTKP